MRKIELASIGLAIAVGLYGWATGVAPAVAQSLPPGAVQGGIDASRLNSPSQDFFRRGRQQLETEIRLLDTEGGFDGLDGNLLTIDESLEPENWLYPLEEFAEPELEVEIRIVPSAE